MLIYANFVRARTMARITCTSTQWCAHVKTCARRPCYFWIEASVINASSWVEVAFSIYINRVFEGTCSVGTCIKLDFSRINGILKIRLINGSGNIKATLSFTSWDMALHAIHSFVVWLSATCTADVFFVAGKIFLTRGQGYEPNK